MLPSQLRIIGHFLRARRRFRTLRGPALAAFQDRRARRIVEYARRHAPYYRERLCGLDAADWQTLAPIGKTDMMAHFGTFNTRGISREAAMQTALSAEQSRDFQPTLQGITVGLSSGTSGHRGLFLAHPWEQAGWAGVMLARALPGLRARGYRVALFLRSNSNLYERLGSRWLQFRYFDLMTPLEEAVAQLNAFAPDILVGPPSLLACLADAQKEGRLRIEPEKLFSAAETLEPQDRERIETVFQRPLHQIYQCTEGLLAISCPHNRLHIQEDVVAIQMEPLPGGSGEERYAPIITDLWRRTQPIIRYRLNDILTLDSRACPCGSAFRVIDRIEGRCDDILYFPSRAGGLRPFFPDTIRRMALLADAPITDYQAFQSRPGEIRIHLETLPREFDQAAAAVRACVEQTLAQYDCRPAQICIEPGLEPVPPDRKRRRVQRLYSQPSADA